MPASASQPVVEDAGRDLPAFASTSAVAEKEALAVAASRIVDSKANAFVGRLETAPAAFAWQRSNSASHDPP
jgi:hypothetical protein